MGEWWSICGEALKAYWGFLWRCAACIGGVAILLVLITLGGIVIDWVRLLLPPWGEALAVIILVLLVIYAFFVALAYDNRKWRRRAENWQDDDD